MAKWETVRVKKETKEYLTQIAGYMQMNLKKDVSIDDVIQEMIRYLPKSKVTTEPPRY